MGKQYSENGQNNIALLRDQAEQRLGRDFPSLSYDRLAMVDTSTVRLVIDDVSYRSSESVAEAIEMMQLACKGEVQVYDAQNLTLALAGKIERLLDIVNVKKTVVIFPGQGAQVVKELLPQGLLNDITTIDVPTQRNVDQRGVVQGVTLTDVTKLRKTFADVKPQTIIVLDDVVTTGTTLRKLQEAAPGRNQEWFAGTLLTLSPLQRKGKETAQSGIPGYNGVLTAIVYQGTTGIPALNSISTLVGDSPKSEAVRGKYMNFVAEPEIFLESAEQIRESVRR